MQHPSHFRLTVLVGALSVALSPVVLAQDLTLDGRIGRIERILENQSGSNLMLQMQQLQTEVQGLRGTLEAQKIEIDKLQRQQRDQYLDIDSRLGASRPAAPATPTDGAAPAGDTTPALPEGMIDASGGGLDTLEDTIQRDPAAAAPIAPGPIGIPSLPTPETVGGNERDAYSQAFSLLKERQYDPAKDAFNDLLQRYPQGEFTDNARYWLAETYYVQRNYPAALTEFDRLIKLHPSSPKVPAAMLKIGYIQADQNANEQARESLQKVISSYPKSTEARLARSRLERLGEGG